MFTGIVEEIGLVQAIRRAGSALQLAIHGPLVSQDASLGDSISVNGVCLTITRISAASLEFDVVPETFRQSSLAGLQVNHRVNLERAMAAGGRYGGHMVSGHVDTTGTIRSIQREANAWVLEIEPSDAYHMRYMVSRGSIALDGISLTLNQVNARTCTVSIIPHTFDNTCLKEKRIGDVLNIEVDLIAKYVERLLQVREQTGITEDFLSKHGFMG